MEDLTDTAKGLGRGSGFEKLNKEMDGVEKHAREIANTMKDIYGSPIRSKGRQDDEMKRMARSAETLQTRLRDLGREQSRIDAIRRRSRDIPDDLAKAERRLADAKRETAAADAEVRRIAAKPDRTVEELRQAERAYANTKKSATDAERAITKLNDEMQTNEREAQDIINRYDEVSRSMASIARTARGKSLLGETLSTGDLNTLRSMGDAVDSLANVMGKVGRESATDMDRLNNELNDLKKQRGGIEAITDTFDGLKKAATQAGRDAANAMREAARESAAMDKVQSDRLTKAVGSVPQTALRAANALREQNEETIKLSTTSRALGTSISAFQNAENAATRALGMGNNAVHERANVTNMYREAVISARNAQRQSMTDNDRLLRQQRELTEQQQQLNQQIDAARANRDSFTAGTAAYTKADDELEQLRASLRQVDEALNRNQQNINENARTWSDASRHYEEAQQSQQNFTRSMSQLQANLRGVQPFQALLNNIRQINTTAMTLASTLASRLRGALSAATGAARGFTNSAGNLFAGLQRALQSTGAFFDRFADRVVRSMSRAHSSMMELYAAGFVLTMMGSQLQQFGLSGFRNMGQTLQDYMTYEQRAIQAAIAGAESRDAYATRTGQQLPTGQAYYIDRGTIDQLVFDLQRGMSIPWVEGGRPIPVTFEAAELAQGLYYYSSAIGVPITQQNRQDVGAQVATIMQAARVTNTGLETAIKGVMNIAMEFGINPRETDPRTGRLVNAESISRIAAQTAYLSNISTMEMSDIVETFKMLGPMAHILSGGATGMGEAGAGLEESFLLTFLASEVGLRGGNVGRGVNQLLTNLLDPSDKMLEVAAQYFGEQAGTLQGFNDLFFDESGQYLRGGLTGLFDTLTSLPEEEQARMLAALFTTNATRSGLGIIEGFNMDAAAGLNLDEWLATMRSDDPFEWLGQAAAETADSVSGWFAFMTNAWFQFRRAITDSVSGPMMDAFRVIGEVLFELAEQIMLNPAIGQTIAAIVTAVSGLAAIGGTIMIAAGGVLLLGRAFAMMGGFVAPAMRMLAFAGVTLLGLIPLFGLVALGVALFGAAVDANLFGIADAFDAVQNAFANFDTVISPMIQNGISWIMEFGQAFQQFFSGILVGATDDFSSLFGFLQDFFGPLIGGAMIEGLLKLNDALESTRDSVRDFLSGNTFDVSMLRNAGLLIQAFFEEVLFGQRQLESFAVVNQIGEAFGITNLNQTFDNAAGVVRNFVGQVIAAAQQIGSVWLDISGQIWRNIGRIFGGDMSGILSGIGVVFQGIVTGITAGFTAILSVVEMVTDKIADFAEALRDVSSEGRTFMGMAVNFNNILRAVGITLGLFFGARFLLMFSPITAMLIRIIPLVTGLASILVGLGGRFLVLAANIAITTAAYIGQAAIMAVLLTAKLASTAVTLAMAGAEAIASLQMGILTGTAAVLAGVLSIVVAVILAVIAALAAFAIGMTFVAGMMIVMIASTQGFGAALDGLISFLSGVWSGLQIGITVVSAFIQGLMWAADAIAGVIGVGSGLEVMGIAVGVALSGILIILTALAAAAVVAFVSMAAGIGLLFGPLILLSAAIIGIGLAFYNAWNDVKSFGTNVDGLFDQLVKTVELAGARMGEAIVNSFIDAFNQLVQQAARFSGFGNMIENIFGAKIGDSTIGHVTWSQDLINKWTAQQNGAAPEFAGGAWYLDEARRIAEEQAAMGIFVEVPFTIVGEPTSESNGFMKILDMIGVGDMAREFLVKLNIDPSSFSLSDLTSADWSQLLNLPSMEEAMKKYDFGDQMNQYIEDLAQWEQRQKAPAASLIDKVGAPFGMNFLGDRPDIGDYFEGFGDEALEGAEEASDKIKEANDMLMQALQGMSLEDMVAKAFDLNLGSQGKSVAGVLAEVGEQILTNVGDAGPWMDMTELFADAAGMGQLDENVLGQNLHTALAPAMQILSQQTGLTMEELMKDVPKFWAPTELVNMATTDLMQGLNKMPQQAFLALDTFGVAEGWTEFGIQWSELSAYAAGQAAAGVEWDLVDYIMESFGVTRQQATQALANAGIFDPSIISSAWFEDTEQLALSLGGQLNVLTEEMYGVAQQWAGAADGMAISITESELAALPDEVKLYLDALGYVFVLDDTSTDISAWSTGVVAAADAAYAAVAAAMGGSGLGQPVFDPSGNLVPQGGRPVTGITDEGWSAGQTARQNASAGTGNQPSTTSMLGLPTPAQAASYGNEIATAVNNAIQTNIKVDAPQIGEQFTQLGVDAATRFSAGLSLTLTGGNLFGAIAMGLSSQIVSQFTAMGQQAGAAFSRALSAAMGAATSAGPTAGGGVGGSGIGAASGLGGMGGAGSGFEIKITANTDEVTSALSDIQMKLSSLSIGQWPINISAPNFVVIVQNLTDIRILAETLTSTTYNVNVSVPNLLVAIQNLTDIRILAEALTASTYSVGVDVPAYAAVVSNLSDIRTMADNVVGTYTVTVAVSGYADVISNLSEIRRMADNIVGTYTATVAIGGNAQATLSKISGQLSGLNGRVATSTVNVNTNRTTYTSQVDLGITKRAVGGPVMAGSPYLVGEHGPELIMPMMNGYVFTAQETSKMLSSSAATFGTSPFLDAAKGDDNGQIIYQNNTNNYFGDVHLESEAAVDRFFEKIDEKQGKKMNLAQRGMRPTDGRDSW